MALRLTKTLLSQKPSPQSVLVGLTSYLVLLVIFLINNPLLSANGHVVYENGQYWRAFTTTLMHADFTHLGHNTLFFTGLAVMLNYYFGFWVFPLLSLLIGGVINLIALKIYPPQVYLVGISGVIYFMAAFWMVMFINLERQMKLSKRVIIALGVSLILLWPEVIDEKTSYLAHALGFGFGIPSALLYYRLNWRKLRSHEVWQEHYVYHDEELEAQALNYPLDAQFSSTIEPEDEKTLH